MIDIEVGPEVVAATRTVLDAAGERFGFVYEINYLRCIHCDLCVEACPTEAITESKLFEFSFTSRTDAIYTKTELVVDDQGKPQQMPWEDWRPGEEEHTSGWMRATSPSGDATFVGEVGWSTELGFGLRKAEFTQHRLLFVVSALRQLLADDHFATLLRAEGLDSLPKQLADRVWPGGHPA